MFHHRRRRIISWRNQAIRALLGFSLMNTITSKIPAGVQVLGEVPPAFAEILTPDALAFVAKLQRDFGFRREACLQNRQVRQAALDRAFLASPTRFKGRRPPSPALPTAAWINPPP